MVYSYVYKWEETLIAKMIYRVSDPVFLYFFSLSLGWSRSYSSLFSPQSHEFSLHTWPVVSHILSVEVINPQLSYQESLHKISWNIKERKLSYTN